MSAVDLVVVSAGVSEPSSTRLLADRAAAKVAAALSNGGSEVRTTAVEVAALAGDIAAALVGGAPSEALRAAFDALARADVVIAVTPVYKAGVSGLFKSFVDLLDDDLLIGKVVLIGATAGSARHAMVLDDHLRALFAYLRTVTVPTSVFAVPDDWADPALGRRLDRAAVEVAALHGAGLQTEVGRRSWGAYRHSFGTTRDAVEPAGGVDFDTPLMRLAAGGSVTPPESPPDTPPEPVRPTGTR